MGSLTAQPIGTEGVYEMTRAALVRGNWTPQGACDNGRHEATSKAPFGLVVWGWGSAATGGDYQYAPDTYSQCVSYAYPAGAAIEQINTVEVPVPK